MSDEEHSDFWDEFYYPEVKLEEYKISSYHFNKVQREDVNETQNNSQEEIDEFIRCQKSANTVKKTTTDMNAFYRYPQLK